MEAIYQSVKKRYFWGILLIVTQITYSLASVPRTRTQRHTKAHIRVQKRSLVPQPFSGTASKFFEAKDYEDKAPLCIWDQTTPFSFNELIVSWNAQRPKRGKITIWVSVKKNEWSPWHRMAVWGSNFQQTFVNKLNTLVHTKHVRVELQQRHMAQAFRVKAVFSDGAQKTDLRALFVCYNNSKHFRIKKPSPHKQSVIINDVPRQSQMDLQHERHKDLCSPTSLAMITSYLNNKLTGKKNNPDIHNSAIQLAKKVHDNGIDIYGNWLLNVAQAYDTCKGLAFFRVERLNSFDDLLGHLERKIPIAVSVRKLRGGATPYANGHFIVVVGWDKAQQRVICIDPAFRPKQAMLKRYHINNFLRAWGLSKNLSYVPLLTKVIS